VYNIDCENFSPTFSQILLKMRLLQYNGDGNFSLIKNFVDGEILECVILSHIWGPDIEEITYRDIIDGIRKNKVEYKIWFYKGQVRHDGL
jgi:hypothetical protein